MPETVDEARHSREQRSYEVCLRGVLSEGLIAELGAERESSDTILVVRADDRAELHGFIRRVEDLGLELVSIVEKDVA